MSESTITDQRHKEIQLTLEGLPDVLAPAKPALPDARRRLRIPEWLLGQRDLAAQPRRGFTRGATCCNRRPIRHVGGGHLRHFRRGHLCHDGALPLSAVDVRTGRHAAIAVWARRRVGLLGTDLGNTCADARPDTEHRRSYVLVRNFRLRGRRSLAVQWPTGESGACGHWASCTAPLSLAPVEWAHRWPPYFVTTPSTVSSRSDSSTRTRCYLSASTGSRLSATTLRCRRC